MLDFHELQKKVDLRLAKTKEANLLRNLFPTGQIPNDKIREIIETLEKEANELALRENEKQK